MKQTPLPSALILAAGYATRMGGQPKALCPVAGITALKRVVTAFQTAGITDIIVVTGHEHEAVAKAAYTLGAKPVINRQFANGMFSSVLCGISALDAKVPAVCITPVDAALILPRTVTALMAFWQQSPSSIILPCLLSLTGHPAILPRRHFSALAIWEGSYGLREYFASLLPKLPDSFGPSETPDLYQLHKQHRSPNQSDFLAIKRGSVSLSIPPPVPNPVPLMLLPMPDAGIISDIDTPEDLHAAKSLISQTKNRSLPTIAEAWHITAHADISAEKKAHSKAVALGGLRLALALADKGIPVSPFSVATAGLLHDMLRRKKDHAKHAYTALLAFQWHETAFITGSHTSLPPIILDAIDINLRDTRFFSPPSVPIAKESEEWTALVYSTLCVYLADKHTIDSCFASIEERFFPIKQMYINNSQALDGINNRQNITMAVARHVEQKIDAPLLLTLKTTGNSYYETEIENICSLFLGP